MASPSELPPSSSTTSDMEPSLPDMEEPSSSPPMAYSSPIIPPSSMSSEDHGAALFNSTASLESLLGSGGSTAEPSSSPPMPSSPLLAPSSPIEPPSPIIHGPFPASDSDKQQRILILGATGNQGRGCLRALLSSKHRDNYTIGVLVRDPDSSSAGALSRFLSKDLFFSSVPSSHSNSKLPSCNKSSSTPSEEEEPHSLSLSLSERLSSLDVHLLSADYSSPPSLLHAFTTFAPTTIFFPPPLTSDFTLDLLHATNVISTASSLQIPSLRKLKFIVSTALGTNRRSSFPGWGANGEWHPMSSYWNTKSRIEELVQEAGFESWTIIRPAWFLHSLTQRMVGWSYLGWKDGDKIRTIRTKWKRNTKVAWVDAEDVGGVAAFIIEEEQLQEGEGRKDSRYKNRGVDLAVESITVGELAEKMGKVLGEEVRVRYADEPWTWTTEDEKEGQDYDWETGRTVSDMDPIAISQRWANEFDSSYGVEATRELGLLGRLMTVDEFLERNRELI